MSVPDRLRSDLIRTALGQVTIGCQVVVLEETGSTNDVVRDIATGDWPEGLVVFAEHQTAGRGQRGNKWESAAYQGLCFSLLLRPGIPVEESARLTSWAARAVASTIERQCQVQARVRSPNDVWVNGRKVAGVLVEMLAHPRQFHIAVVGIGLNVNQTSADFPPQVRDIATSLAIETRSPQDRNLLAAALLRELDQTYSLVSGGMEQLG